MTRAAIVEIAKMGQSTLGIRLYDSAVEYEDSLDFEPIDLQAVTAIALHTSADVSKYGAALQGALCQHPAIASELQQIYLTQPPSRAMLQFLMNSLEAERVRWEAVCQNTAGAGAPRYLALNAACSLSRMTKAVDRGALAFSLPIRMAAFLSPARITAEDEFAAIASEITAARAAGLQITCRVYSGEEALLDAGQDAINAGSYTGITMAPIPASTVELEKVLKEQPVEILHFFCHGVMEAGVRALELATINDWETEESSGSLKFSSDRLKNVLLATGTTWLTVLNSCSGAAADQLHSMALTLVKGASAYALGMAEPVDAPVATTFCGAFYRPLLETLRTSLQGLTVGQHRRLDLTPAVATARQHLHAKYGAASPNTFGHWCLPLLYQGSSPLQVTMIDDTIKARAEAIAGVLRSLPPTTPDDARDAVLSTLDKDPVVPKALRPDRFGVFAA